MNDNGVVRKIDELGRLTLPKDMRKKLRIKDDEFIELVLNNDSITLKKHIPIEENNNFYNNYADAIHLETGKNVAISNRDKILATAGEDLFKQKYMNQPVSDALDEIIQNRYVFTCDESDNVALAAGIEEKLSCVISPICSGENAIGTVIICSTDNEKIDELLVKTSSIAAKFLGKNIVD